MPGRELTTRKAGPTQECPIADRVFTDAGPKANKYSLQSGWRNTMKNLSIIVPAAIAGVLLAATVLAAPQTVTTKVKPAGTPDRAAAYALATAD
jgi:hypothetical protein